MKHLIIILSFIIISTNVFGENHNGGILYLLGEFPDWEWVNLRDKKNLPKYQGKVKNGKPNGLGVLTSTNGWKYFGSWKDGKIWNGTEFDNLGNIIFRWVEGKRKYHNLNIKFR